MPNHMTRHIGRVPKLYGMVAAHCDELHAQAVYRAHGHSHSHIVLGTDHNMLATLVHFACDTPSMMAWLA
jgi:hypothetical protein